MQNTDEIEPVEYFVWCTFHREQTSGEQKYKNEKQERISVVDAIALRKYLPDDSRQQKAI